jgi:hypothetical protein
MSDTYLERAEKPQKHCLEKYKHRVANAKGEVDAYVFARIAIATIFVVGLGPSLEPHAACY